MFTLAIFGLMIGCMGSAESPQEMPPTYTLVYYVPQSVVADVWMNGEPAGQIVGPLSGSRDVTCLVVRGGNTIKVQLRGERDGPATGSQIEVVSCVSARNGARTARVVHIEDSEYDSRAVREKSGEFAAEMPLRWIWQRADRIGQLGEKDRLAIESCMDELVKTLHTKDYKAFTRLRKSWWAGDTAPARRDKAVAEALHRWVQREERALASARSVTMMPDSERVLLVGKHLVLVARKASGTEGRQSQKLIGFEASGRNTGGREVGVSYGDQFLYFYRSAGKWHVLAHNWRV